MDLFSMLFFVVVLIFSAIIHEYSHGWMADTLGDPTARYAGRLTLNPKAHLDMWGSIILPILLIPTGFLFAYAKPVPYNPYNLKDARWDPVKVAIAGPLSNIILAFVVGVMVQVMPVSAATQFLMIIVHANVLLAVFNMVPIPPLDGSKLLFALLPPEYAHIQHSMEKHGFIFLLLFIMVGFKFISPIMAMLNKVFLTWMSF